MERRGTDARRDWNNVSYILESFSQHGGQKELEAYLSLNPGDGTEKVRLRDIEAKAGEVFGNWAGNRDDQDQANWQAAHVTKMAAIRLR